MAKAAELMKVIPVAAVSAAYVALVKIGESADLTIRTYDAEGVAIADVGAVTDPGVTPGEAAAFVRGATAGSLNGCAVGFLLGTDLHVIDLEALGIVAPATTHRLSGDSLEVALAAGADKFWECGTASADGFADDFAYLRTVSVDGGTIASVAASIASPYNDEEVFDTAGFRPILIATSPLQWAIPFHTFFDGGDSPVSVVTVNESASTATVANRTSAVSGVWGALPEGIGVPIGSSTGGPLDRVILTTAALTGTEADSYYETAALFNVTGFTPLSSSVNRDGTVLVWQADGASRICTWDGSHPIGDADDVPGPTFAGDFGGTETLLWIFGL